MTEGVVDSFVYFFRNFPLFTFLVRQKSNKFLLMSTVLLFVPKTDQYFLVLSYHNLTGTYESIRYFN